MPANKTILLVEDEPLILMDLEYAVQDAGSDALCASDLNSAMRHLDGDTSIDAAVLDVALRNGESCVPFANELKRRGIPFLLHTGDTGSDGVARMDIDAETVAKPASANIVIARALDLGANASAG